MDKEDNLANLSKKELIEVITAYKEELSSVKEYAEVMRVDNNSF